MESGPVINKYKIRSKYSTCRVENQELIFTSAMRIHVLLVKTGFLIIPVLFQGDNMKKYLLINNVIFLLLILLGISSHIMASSIVKYSICKNNVADAVVTSNDNYHTVNIQLTTDATKEFSELTGKNINQRLEILFKDNVVVGAIIKTKITSGRIELRAKTKKEAETLTKKILNDTPTKSCGIISQ